MNFRALMATLLAVPFCVHAQSGMGKIQGTVTDASGASIPGARVEATHVQTSRPYVTATNQEGFYVLPTVQSGEYKLVISSTGMDLFAGEFLLQTGATAVVDATLKVGTASTTVTVSETVAPLVTTTNATLAAITDRARLDQLPVSGRMFQSLVNATTPGVDGASASPRVWGLKWGMEFLQDGAVLGNRDIGEIAGRPPGMDTIEEFRVETNNSSAKMNRPGTVIVNTRAGTNKFHGSLFEIMRNNNLGFGVARAAGQVEPAASSGAQRVRRLGGRSDYPAEDLQRKESYVLLYRV